MNPDPEGIVEESVEEETPYNNPPTIVAIICTSNEIKLKATIAAFKQFFPQAHLDIVAESVESDLLPQPIGYEQVIGGAKERAIEAVEKIKEQRQSMVELLDDEQKKWVFGIGVEAGLINDENAISNYLDFQYCVIIDLNGRMTIGSGPGWEYPSDITQQILDGKGEQEVAEIMKEVSGNQDIKTQGGAIGFFSNGILLRDEITKIAVQMALIPRLTCGYYSLIKMDDNTNQ